YLAAIYGSGFHVSISAFKNSSARRFVIFSSLTFMITIAFSLIYSYGFFRGRASFKFLVNDLDSRTCQRFRRHYSSADRLAS
ncbi:YndJ family transporter, partial [Bacillus paralicheniformis]|uniref:YndJ family transporter n=1 Tax=Bacillus paralicheniformis TaxID=1648923 RepID=UPI002DBA32D9